MGDTATLRPAVEADLASIAEIWHVGWVDGHEDFVPDELLAHRTRATFDVRAAGRIADTTVAVSDGSVVGFVMVVDDELEQLYVDRSARGTGAADELIAAAEQQIARDHDVAWLAVVAGNARARRFYERTGWVDAGPIDYQATTDDGTFTVPSHRYEKPLLQAG